MRMPSTANCPEIAAHGPDTSDRSDESTLGHVRQKWQTGQSKPTAKRGHIRARHTLRSQPPSSEIVAVGYRFARVLRLEFSGWSFGSRV
eukprot:8035-Rhodomonas_salina.2